MKRHRNGANSFNFRNRLTPPYNIINFTSTICLNILVDGDSPEIIDANFYHLFLLRGQDQRAVARFWLFAGNEVTVLTKEDVEHVEGQKSVFFELDLHGIEFISRGCEYSRSSSGELGTSGRRG